MNSKANNELVSIETERPLRAVWADAYNLWLNSLASENTRRCYHEIWQLLIGNINKMPWEVTRADLVRWIDDMRSRGLSACTRNLRIAAVSSFYEYTNDEYTTIVDGREVPLYPYNPASGKSLRVKIDPYGKARALSNDEVRALLWVIDQSTIQGRRDYALIVGYLFTGRRNSELRRLRWGDIQKRGNEVWYRWSGKRKQDQLYEMPAIAWAAIREYLAAAGRLDTIRPDDFIFIGLDGDASAPLCMREVGRMLKSYAETAGLDPDEIHVHILRHTAAGLRRQAGDDIEQVSHFLGHSSLSVTQIYLHRTEGQKDESWSKVKSILGI